MVFQSFQTSANALVSAKYSLTWFSANFLQEDEVRQITPKIIGTIVSNLEHLFMRVTQVSAQDPLLKKLSTLIAIGNRIVDISRNPFEADQGNANNNRASFDGSRTAYDSQRTSFGENRMNFLNR